MIALSVMRMGQPALLYLVPCTLGTTCFLGWYRSEFIRLWQGPWDEAEASRSPEKSEEPSSFQSITGSCHRRGIGCAEEKAAEFDTVSQSSIGRSLDAFI